MRRDFLDIASHSSNTFQSFETMDPERWVPHGYACVRIDARGSGHSPGVLDVWSARQTQDLYQCVEWAAAQPWSNGRVGMAGTSHHALNQWQAAAVRPPHLAAMVPMEGILGTLSIIRVGSLAERIAPPRAGEAQPRMSEYYFSTRVESPRDTLFDPLMDSSNLPRFVSYIQAAERLGDDGLLLRGPGFTISASFFIVDVLRRVEWSVGADWRGWLQVDGDDDAGVAQLSAELRCTTASDALERVTHQVGDIGEYLCSSVLALKDLVEALHHAD